MEFLLCWPHTPKHWVCPGVWLIYSMILQYRKLIFPLLACIDCRVLGSCGTTNLLPPLGLEMPPGLHLCRSCVCCYACEFICASVMSLENIAFWESSILPGSYNLSTSSLHGSLSLERRMSLIKTSYSGQNAPKSLTLPLSSCESMC